MCHYCKKGLKKWYNHIIKKMTYQKLPDKIAAEKVIINIKNKDNKCFMWSIFKIFTS